MAAYQLMRTGVLRVADSAHLTPQSGAAWEAYIAWRQAGNVPDPYVPPAEPAETLSQARLRKKWQIKRDGMERMQLRFPAIDTFDALQLVREMYLSIAPAARQPTTDWQYLIDTYQAGQAGLNAVNAAGTIAAVDAVTVIWPT